MRWPYKAVIAVAGVIGIGMAAVVMFHPGVLPAIGTRGQPARPSSDAITRGQYLARVGDCVACHTSPKGVAFAGGLEMPTPFGSLFSPNITPDEEFGIGLWTSEDFYRMLHTGISKDGSLLYPAMPFASYTEVTRADSDAMFDYLQSVTPVRQANHPQELKFPFNNRDLLIGWRALYLQVGEFVADSSETRQWNRGAYLVQGLGHCTMCHTPVNALGGNSESKAFEGGMIPNQNWYAPSLTENQEAGLSDWPVKEIADLLQVGTTHRATTYGPMAQVVYDSLQYLTDEDAEAMAVYLKALPRRDSEPAPSSHARLVQPAVMELGRTVYAKQCAVCHGDEGKGQERAYPELAGNHSITMLSPVNSIRMVLNGGYAPGTQKNPRPYGMPPFSQILNDNEVAAVVTYIRVAWNNDGTPVLPAQANALRKIIPEE